MPSILNEYAIKKIALFAVFVLAVIGIIYWFLAMPFRMPFVSTGTPQECIDENRQKEGLLEAGS